MPGQGGHRSLAADGLRFLGAFDVGLLLIDLGLVTPVVVRHGAVVRKVKSPVEPDPGLDDGGEMPATVPTLVRDESMIDAEPMLPVWPASGNSLKPVPKPIMVMDLDVHPQSQITWMPTVQPLKVSRWA